MTEFSLPRAVRIARVGENVALGYYVVAEDDTTMTLAPNLGSGARAIFGKLPDGRLEYRTGEYFEIRKLGVRR